MKFFKSLEALNHYWVVKNSMNPAILQKLFIPNNKTLKGKISAKIYVVLPLTPIYIPFNQRKYFCNKKCPKVQ